MLCPFPYCLPFYYSCFVDVCMNEGTKREELECWPVVLGVCNVRAFGVGYCPVLLVLLLSISAIMCFYYLIAFAKVPNFNTDMFTFGGLRGFWLSYLSVL